MWRKRYLMPWRLANSIFLQSSSALGNASRMECILHDSHPADPFAEMARAGTWKKARRMN
jgi:hypothetical protein